MTAFLLMPAAIALILGSLVFLRPAAGGPRYLLFWGCLALGEALDAAFLALSGAWPPAAIYAAVALLAAWQWWRHWRRRRRDRARASLGAKSRALRDALVRRMRESLAPRPGPVPVPSRA